MVYVMQIQKVVQLSSKSLWLLGLVIHSQNLDPFAVVEIALSIGERTFEQLINLANTLR